MKWSHCVYPVAQPILRRLRRNRWIIGRLFGVKIPPGLMVQFDPTTILLSRAVRQWVDQQPHSRSLTILEMGIGQGALISLSVAAADPARNGVSGESLGQVFLEGVDCSPSRVAGSIEVASYNRLDATFWQSDLFSTIDVQKKYDAIFFNPPYVPTAVGNELRLTSRLQVDADAMWDGGVDGTEVMRAFLREAPRHLKIDGRILFGVQSIFVSDLRIVEVIDSAGLELQERIQKPRIPAMVYVVAPR